MSNNNITGNKVKTNDLLRLLLTLKQNIMKDLNVAEVCKIVSKQSNNRYYVSLANDSSKKLSCVSISSDEFKENQQVVVVFTNTNYLNKDDKELHSSNFGIILGSGGGGGGGSAIEVIDNLLSSSSTAALSANQGRILKSLIDNMNAVKYTSQTLTEQQQSQTRKNISTTKIVWRDWSS